MVLELNVLVSRHFYKDIPEDGLKLTKEEYSRSWASHDYQYWRFWNRICVK
ncbi:uncharacterized protein TrAtP1_009183 [Trichoderma atroviride]|uniref:uncharacterized protein n=1 Tax=Hypocrea atroviridis TaxID=63577 RepID=UPI0033182CB9|nr:hypothetical protein TrAtP1_009183 [Trichoderma atroviride]